MPVLELGKLKQFRGVGGGEEGCWRSEECCYPSSRLISMRLKIVHIQQGTPYVKSPWVVSLKWVAKVRIKLEIV